MLIWPLVIIIALVPARLLIMNRLWPKETLRFVDAWACRTGTPEDEMDQVGTQQEVSEETVESTIKERETAAV